MNKYNPKLFGMRLGKHLKYMGIKQADFARSTDLTQAAVSQIVNGEREPSIHSICKILEQTGLSFERLVASGESQNRKSSRGA